MNNQGKKRRVIELRKENPSMTARQIQERIGDVSLQHVQAVLKHEFGPRYTKKKQIVELCKNNISITTRELAAATGAHYQYVNKLRMQLGLRPNH